MIRGVLTAPKHTSGRLMLFGMATYLPEPLAPA